MYVQVQINLPYRLKISLEITLLPEQCSTMQRITYLRRPKRVLMLFMQRNLSYCGILYTAKFGIQQNLAYCGM